jgi:hypothetical protein
MNHHILKLYIKFKKLFLENIYLWIKISSLTIKVASLSELLHQIIVSSIEPVTLTSERLDSSLPDAWVCLYVLELDLTHTFARVDIAIHNE